jgi:hypothetical protein
VRALRQCRSRRARLRTAEDPPALKAVVAASSTGSPNDVAAGVEAWRAAGTTHVEVNPARSGLSTTDEHIDALTRTAEALDRQGQAGTGSTSTASDQAG